MTHKYELEKYKGIRSRHECPACHHKGVFARYVDTDTGAYLHSDVGRCNREDKCGYHYTPGQYFKDNPDEREFAAHGRSTPIRQSTPGQPGKIDRIPKQYIIQSLGYNSNFVRFLLSLFDHYTLESPTVVRLMSDYYLGCTKDGSVIFWQIDTRNRIRAGKIMQYNPDTGKRIKSQSGAIDWVHSKLKRIGKLADTWKLSQCLFGEHLLQKRPNDTICMVESEKSAIIGSGAMPGYIWMSTGGKQNLKAEKCECLKGRNVVLFPDLGAFDQWMEKGKEIAQRVGFSLTVSTVLERIATPDDRRDGLDIADYLIRQIQTQSNTPVSFAPLTREEEILQQMNAKNPAIMQLITSLGLVSTSTGKQIRTA
ncbi:DUF6371 domain-containing protein [Alistipes sp.]|uniref:DUF6371 domain-containing protein n=1 Tax=Alistipes sp. TaxID=1872444 RepID=UPI003AF9A843